MTALVAMATSVRADRLAADEWDPATGSYGRLEDRAIRIVTWNVYDSIRTEAQKTEGFNSWTALARIVAALDPDVLLLQECADNGSSGAVDSVSELTTVLQLFVDGGTDHFTPGSPEVTSFVSKYRPGFSAETFFASGATDGFNRNALLSSFDELDANGDGQTRYSDIPPIFIPDAYSGGGDAGIRGFQFVELDLPDEIYRGDLIVGNGHLKAGGSSSDRAQRREAAQNLAYFIDYWYNGAGQGVPDPNNVILDQPQATHLPDPDTAVVVGGDLNEDELINGSQGPALWLSTATILSLQDGTDRDRSASTYDDARDPFTDSRRTLGSSKLDYVLWQDSIATFSNSFIFDTDSMVSANLPDELSGMFLALTASDLASDHLPVIVDLLLPIWFDSDDDSRVDLRDLANAFECVGESSSEGNCSKFDVDRGGTVGLEDFTGIEELLTGP